jgi:putative ABC transport system ATP-binding protein
VSGEIVITVEKVSKQYGSGDTEVRALNDVTVEMRAGELIGVVGPSGSGKTTFLLIAGLIDAPTSGAVLFRGEAISMANTKLNTLRDLRREHIGLVFQRPNLIPFLTALQNVQIALTIHGTDGAGARKRALALLDQLDVGRRAGNYPSQLSGGEQQRVAIARALANRPTLILADEPTASLDSTHGRQVMQILRELANREGVSVCVVTHDQRSFDLFDRLIEIKDGHVANVDGPARTSLHQ